MYLFEEMNNTPPKEVKSKEKVSSKKEIVDPKKVAKLNDIVKAFKTPIDDFENLVAEEPSVYVPEKEKIQVREESKPMNENVENIKKTFAIESAEKKILKIVVFYEDKTFEEYKPNT